MNSTEKIFHFEDFLASDLDEKSVGRKGLSLFKLHEADVPVPDFFVISTDIFKEYIKRVVSDGELLEKGAKLEARDMYLHMKRHSFERNFVEEIKRQYVRLSGFVDSWVSIRSSVSCPHHPEVSFSGVFDTKLNVRGIDHVVDAIHSVYANFFSDGAIKYCSDEGVELADLTLAVVVQKMVQAEVSGVCFTVDPITQDQTRMSIEAVYGLGSVISDGEITPDSYALNKKDLSIVEKHISPQEWMKIRSLNSTHVDASEKIQISPSWSHRQKLDDHRILDVAKISLILEDKLGEAQDIEWVYGGGKTWVLQSKSAFGQVNTKRSTMMGYHSFVSDSMYKVVKEIVSKQSDTEQIERRAVEDATKMVVEREKETPVEPTPILSVKQDVTPREETFIASGIGASFGSVEGRIKILTGGVDVVAKDEIAVIDRYNREMYQALLNASGVITRVGGLTSDVSITCRELNIPAVVGVSSAMNTFKTGDMVRLDGNSGNIYMIRRSQAMQQVVANEIASKIEETAQVEPAVVRPSKDSNIPVTATKVFSSYSEYSEDLVNADGIGYVSLDSLMLNDGRHPVAYLADGKYKEYGERVAKVIDQVAANVSPDPVIVSIGSGKVSAFRELVKGREYEDETSGTNTFGVTRYLNNKKALDVALRIVRRVRNIHHDRNVMLAVHSPLNGENMKEIKKSINASGLRRTNTFDIYAVIESPAEVLVLDDILSADIDGVIVNTPYIAKYMQGVHIDDMSTKIDLYTGSMAKVIEDVSKKTREKHLKLVVDTQNDQELIKACVKLGVYAVIVSNTEILKTKQLVSSEESKILLGIR